MKYFPLTQGKFALVDEADFDRCCQFSWQAQKIGTGWIVKRGIWDKVKKNNKSQPLAVFILGLPAGTRVDHKNGNPFDNRRENLRVCSKVENERAFRRKSPGKSSRYRGVTWDKQHGCWLAHYSTGGKYFFVLLSDCEIEAALARDAAVRALGWPVEGQNFIIT